MDTSPTNEHIFQLPLEAPLIRGEEPTEMDRVLRAFQALMVRHGHVRSVVASSLGIGVSDLRALLFISSSDVVTPKQVGAYLELTSGAVTNLIDRMSDADLVHRSPHPHDRRSVVLTLAPRGTESVARVIDLYRRAFASAVGADQLPVATEILSALGESLIRTANKEIADTAD